MRFTMPMVMRYLDACRSQKRLDPKTVKAYRIDLRQFLRFASERDTEFSREVIKDYIAQMNEIYKPSTVKRKVASLRAFCNYWEEEGSLPENPFLGFRLKLQTPVLLPKTIPLRVVERMLAAPNWRQHQEAGSVPLRDAAVMELLFATGVRVSELCGLRTADVDLVDGMIRIYGKGAKERLIQLTNAEVITVLRCYRDAYQPLENGTFFQNRDGGRLSEQSVRAMLRRYTEKVGVATRITPHMFRHSLATMLLEEEVDIRYIQQLLGHASIMTTQIYTHVAAAKQRDILTSKHPRNKFSVSGFPRRFLDCREE